MEVHYCVLLYGDYPHLAERVLGSMTDRLRLPNRRITVGMNAVSAATRDYVQGLQARGLLGENAVVESKENIHKYPMMRQLFYRHLPTSCDAVCWFDDDSYLKPVAYDWEQRLEVAMQGAEMVGSLYWQRFAGNQHLWVRHQPWYTGKPVEKGHRALFATGGWWCIWKEILWRHNWPIPELDHRGGDMMLGELCRQQGYRLRKFNDGVAINADARGRESKAKRRGFDSMSIGTKFTPAAAPLRLPM